MDNTQAGANGSNEDKRGLLPRQFEYLFNEISKIQARHQLKKERNGKSSTSRGRSTVSPSGAKYSSANYQQFEDMEEI